MSIDISSQIRRCILNEIDESLLEGYVNIFFENPKAKWKMEKDENVILYGDGERTISAYKDGYFNYSFSNVTNKNISLEDAIKVADKKLKLDTY